MEGSPQGLSASRRRKRGSRLSERQGVCALGREGHPLDVAKSFRGADNPVAHVVQCDGMDAAP